MARWRPLTGGVNWWPDKPELLYKELVAKARKVGLEVDDNCSFDKY